MLAVFIIVKIVRSRLTDVEGLIAQAVATMTMMAIPVFHFCSGSVGLTAATNAHPAGV